MKRRLFVVDVDVVDAVVAAAGVVVVVAVVPASAPVAVPASAHAPALASSHALSFNDKPNEAPCQDDVLGRGFVFPAGM
ncbi:hypothetical protein HP567_017100 [Brevibacillus sp. M2.1A]|nr:hypothetical protein [Brevibacillus sp. M2.1A]MCC8436261.1 hypothetical protein [Brevibacillus sp. M2.1A]